MPPYRSGGRLQPKQLPSAQGACRLGLCREIQALQMAAGTSSFESEAPSAIRFTYPDVKNDNRVAFVTAVSGMTPRDRHPPYSLLRTEPKETAGGSETQ